ncbi:MAG: Fic family protein [Desulfovibrionaceae bacterium]|nr:Fic family protein [Desulfovibrionaceae bacterium]
MNHSTILTEKTKIFLAHTALHLEGIHLNEVQIKDLLDKNIHEYFDADEEDAIVMRNVVNALNYLESIIVDRQVIDLNLYITFNAILAYEQALETGHLRTRPVVISCIPNDIPPCEEKDVVGEIKKIATIDDKNFKKVISSAFCKLIRMQPFFDGNKRSTAFLCNAAILKKNLGLFVINYENLGKFELLLTDYYTKKNNDILQFIEDELILSPE